MSKELAPRLDPRAIEPARYKAWQAGGYFHVPASAVLEDGREPYVIVIPPPNVTAALHMGHGLNNTIQDVLIRWRRMQGRAALWVPGTDHAGIATQNVVERKLAEAGSTRQELGREVFVERVWDFVGKTGGTILEQLKAIGASCDWERTRFTLDDDLARAVREVFVSLYEKDLIYRGEYIINWCPRCLTALSNEEAEGEETEGRLWHLRYPLPEASWDAAKSAVEAGAEAIGQFDDGRWYLTVSTTRPETMLGDTGVAVHPSDERYKALVGADVELPLTGRLIPVVADRHVDPEFGSGMVKVTPAHDKNDFEIAGRTGLEIFDVMTPDAHMSDSAPEAFRGMDRFAARKAVLAAIEAEGLRAGEDMHTHAVPHCYRCGTVVEPRLSEQWFVSMKPLAEPALAASKDGTITFTPPHWKRVYEHWMENIQDWCISRQLWWGHRIPVWYCDCGEEIVAREDPTECPKCGGSSLQQDPDVLDTWFSSQLWPFSVFGWPNETDDMQAFYPGHTMVTAPEILFFWVARMIMMGYEFQGEAPFTEVYLHGTVRDMKGRKMSKSLGNGIDPLEVVEEIGADAMRFTIVSQCAVGTDISLDHENVEAAFANGRNFANKIWNAGRFALMSVGEAPIRPLDSVRGDLAEEDRWILSRLANASAEATQGLERFRLHEVAEGLYHFFWGEICDWYLELVKSRLGADADEASREAARTTLVTVLDGAFRLLHPIVPFVTAELWSRLPWPEGVDRPEDVIIAPWPTASDADRDQAVEADMAGFQSLVTEVRRLRKEYGVGEGQRIALFVHGGPDGFFESLSNRVAAVEQLARVDRIESGTGSGVGANAVLSNGAELFVPLEGVIDIERERGRMENEIDKLEGLLVGVEKRLANEKFVANAPEEVVNTARENAAQLQDQAEKLREKLAGLGTESLKRSVSLFVALGAIACAQQEMPPGGPEDLRPPVVVATTPGALEMVTDLGTEIRFDFDERISERVSGGALETAISVSPTAGEYEVQHRRRSLTVKMDGGLLPGLVYRVTLNPTVSDMFGNTITDPFELIFSTGGEPVPTTLAGEVWDRITGRPVAEAGLVAIGADSLRHRSTSDQRGIFAFRYLPEGSFDVTAFEDQNRNGEADSTEVQGSVPMSIAAGDTVLMEVPILTPDTSAANVTGADAVDSTTVAILFDDFLDFEAETSEIELTISSDSADAPGLVELMHETAYIAWVERVTDSLAILDSIEAEEMAAVAATEAASRAAADSAAAAAGDSAMADSVRADSTGVAVPEEVTPADSLAPADTVVVAQVGGGSPDQRPQGFTPREPPPSLPRLEGSTAGPTSDGRRVLPGRRLVARVDAPLPFGTEFTVTVSGVVNIFGLPGGGGETTLLRELVVDSVAIADSIAAADSAAAVDTGAVALPDTGAAALPDTSAVALPDTSAVALPDTSAVALPDTGAVALPDAGVASR